MKLRAFKIDGVTYFCNELQINEAGSLEQAARVEHEKRYPPPAKMKAKTVKVKEEGEQPDENKE